MNKPALGCQILNTNGQQADATDLSKDGTIAFFFKLHGHKHAFEAQTAPERNGWFIAVEKAIAEAKADSEGIVANETYIEQLAKLGKYPVSIPSICRIAQKEVAFACSRCMIADNNRRQARRASIHRR
jgi:hypothetical protein